MRRQRQQLLALVILAVGAVGDAAAELSLDFGIESFRWREFDAGAKLLEETGPRFRAGATWCRPFGAEQRDELQARGSFYIGNVDYDGQACTLSGSCTPFQTNADYYGATGEALYLRRLGDAQIDEFFAGGGIDIWRRDIQGSGNVSGAIEDWTVFYVAVGGGARWSGSATRYHVQAGAKYPFYTTNVPNSFDVILEPKGRVSPFARFTIDFVSGGRPRWGVGLYYDSYRFDTSDVERIGSIQIFQPESRQDLFGIFTSVYLR